MPPEESGIVLDLSAEKIRKGKLSELNAGPEQRVADHVRFK